MPATSRRARNAYLTLPARAQTIGKMAFGVNAARPMTRRHSLTGAYQPLGRQILKQLKRLKLKNRSSAFQNAFQMTRDLIRFKVI